MSAPTTPGRPMYAAYSPRAHEVLTLGGRVICHHDPAQLEWCLPGARATRLPADTPPTGLLPLWAHPDFDGGFDTAGNVIKAAFRDQS